MKILAARRGGANAIPAPDVDAVNGLTLQHNDTVNHFSIWRMTPEKYIGSMLYFMRKKTVFLG